MLRHSLLLALSAVPLAGERSSFRPVPVQSGCVNVIQHEPLLVYEVTGSTLIGPVDLHLVVYSDGAVRIADIADTDAPLADRGLVDPEAVSDLMLDLERYGGMLECDATIQATDVPLHTLTMLKAGTDPRGHTYSWWVPEGASGAIEARIELFIAEVFPEF